MGVSEPDPEWLPVMLLVGDTLKAELALETAETPCVAVMVRLCVGDCVIVGLMVKLTVIEELTEREGVREEEGDWETVIEPVPHCETDGHEDEEWDCGPVAVMDTV